MTVLLALVLLPALGAAGAAAHRAEAYRTGWLVSIAALHLALVGAAWLNPDQSALDGWMAIDHAGLLALSAISVLFTVVALYAVGYLRRESPRGGRAFVSCLLAFLASASLVATSHHFALLWVGLEATTLAVAPLIFHRHDRRSLEAVWKYLMLSSVGIAMALLGTFLLAASQSAVPDTGRPLVLPDLVAAAPRLHPGWLKVACIFLLVGFGTKMGLVPLHAWKPDTYGEAPSLVAGLMAGALTTCAFLALTRMMQVVNAAGLGAFAAPLLLAFGLASLGVAAAFIIGQSDLKRSLAWSSIEHMGVLTLGLGLGGIAVYGALFHVVNNALAKGVLFLATGNVSLGRGSGAAHRGVLRLLPLSGALLVLGLFAVTASPPFGTFVGVFTIVRGAFGAGHPVIGVAALAFMATAFVGIARLIVEMAYGVPAPATEDVRESPWTVAGPLALVVVLVLLGTTMPAPLREHLAQATWALGGRAP